MSLQLTALIFCYLGQVQVQVQVRVVAEGHCVMLIHMQDSQPSMLAELCL